MDFLTLLPGPAIGKLLALIILYKLLWKLLMRTNRSRQSTKVIELAPEPWGAMPLIGHLHLLNSQTPPFKILAAMADKHGPVFGIRLGMCRAVVVSSSEAVKECLNTNDRIFLTRPNSAARKYMGYKGALFGLAPHGPHWREMRKIATVELLSKRQLDLLKCFRASEVDTSIKELYSLCEKGSVGFIAVDLSQWLGQVISNMLVQMISGKRYCSVGNDGESQRFQKAIREFFYLAGVFVVSDVIPCTEWMDLQGHVKAMKRNTKELDYFLGCWVEEHLQRRQNSMEKEDRDFIDVMLSSISSDSSGYKREAIVKATSLNLILAGADTTGATLTWALSLLLNHPESLKIVKEELDIHVGRERWVEESDIINLVYLQAVVKETMRLYPAGPLSAPREAMEDCHIGGYYVPKGTRLLVNIWKLHRDPRVWPHPCEFQPERFLTNHGQMDLSGHHQFEYIPFSSGRRSCPGMLLALQMAHLTLARVVQGFNLTTPMNAPVDMREGLGLSLPKATPLEVIVTPCLSLKLYQQQLDG